MFLSNHVIGIRASLFRCSVEHLRKVCLLHGLDISGCSKARDVKLRLLFHVVNGDCFSQRCEPSCPAPDRSACLCMAGNFSSSLSITLFIVNLLKTSTSLQMSTEDLLVVVESTGSQHPFENSHHLRRRALVSFQAFLLRRRHLSQQETAKIVSDPFGDLFMGFEEKRKPMFWNPSWIITDCL